MADITSDILDWLSRNPISTVIIVVGLMCIILSLFGDFIISIVKKENDGTKREPDGITKRQKWELSIGAILALVGLGLSFVLPAKPCNSPPCPTPTLTVTSSPTATVAATVTATSIPSQFAYDFESGVQGWSTSEGQFNTSIMVTTTTNPVHSGSHALQVTTRLVGNANPAFSTLPGDTPAKGNLYSHTEAVVYFDQSKPNGFSAPGPYDLRGKTVSCYVFFPSTLATGDNVPPYVRLFVKDKKFANAFSQAVSIDPQHTQEWFQLSLTVSSDASFDASLVNALGVRLETPDGSKIDYTGPFYIDDCSIG